MMDLRKVAAAYGGTGSGNQCNIPTPGHSKRDLGTSITIKPGAPDGVLVKCHNGSDEDALAVKDMLRRDGFLPERKARNDNCNRFRVPSRPMHREKIAAGDVTVHAYHDETGRELYRKVRIDHPEGGKQFSWHHNGGRANGKGDEPAIPYRLDEIVGAPDAVIVMAEGEKCADHLAQWGFVATSSKDLPPTLPWMAGRTVAILPDNDETGLKTAIAAKTKVEAAGGKAFMLELDDLPPSGDVCDWKGDADDLSSLLAITQRQNTGLLTSLDLVEMAKVQPPARQWAIEGLVPMGELSLFTGAGSAGKSLLCQQFATAAAAGVDCLRLPVRRTASLYLTCEDDPNELHRRQNAICETLGVDMASLSSTLHLISLRGELDNVLGKAGENGALVPAPLFDRLSTTIREQGIGLVFLDNVAHLFAGNENDRGEVTQFVNLLNRLARDTGAAIVLIGHPNKAGDDYSGSTAWLNAVRSQFMIEHDLNTDFRTLSLGKANYARRGSETRFIWRAGAFVHEDELPPDVAAELAETIKASADNRLFLACLTERNKQRRHVSEKPTAQNFAPKIFATMPESKSIGRKRLTDAMDRLFRIEHIERGFIYRDTAEGKDIYGLRETSGDGREGSGNLSGNLPETPSGNFRKPAENDRKHSPLNTTYYSGAASGSAAPDRKDVSND